MNNLKKAYGDAEGPFGFPLKSVLAKEADDALKEQSTEMYEAFSAEVDGSVVQGYLRLGKAPAAFELKEDERADVSLITTASLDRDFEVVLPGGGDMSAYRRSMVVTFAHDYKSLPVGRSLWLKRNKDSNPSLDGWLAKTKYASAPEGWTSEWFPDAVWHMVKNLYLKGKSIGLIPIEGRKPSEDDIKARPELSAAGWIVSKWKMLEYAVAPVQSNIDALVQGVSKCMADGIHFPEESIERLGLVMPEEDVVPMENGRPRLRHLATEPSVDALTRGRGRRLKTRDEVVRELRKAICGMSLKG